MPSRPLSSHCIQNYPKIQIDRGSVIKPCVADQAASDQFLDHQVSSWRKLLHDIWNEGVPFALRYVSKLKVPNNSNKYYVYFITAIRYLALLMLHVHRVYLHIYGYFYPYSLMSLDEVCDEFARCPNWSEAVIRSFVWHPNYDRCALAICNDYIYVYHAMTRIRVLRHNHQRKITDLAWSPSDKDVLAVATQTSIIIWKINDAQQVPIKDQTFDSQNIAYLAPSVHLIQRKESQINGGFPVNNPSVTRAENSTRSQLQKNFSIIDSVLPAPIISIKFDQSGKKLLCCSPNSSRIAILNVEMIMSPTDNQDKTAKRIEYLVNYGQGITKLVWSLDKNRLATATTSTFIRVFESFSWTCSKWSTSCNLVQDMIWSKPSGRMLLIANKGEECLYALPFLDDPQPKDVGGNKSLMRVLDLTPTRNEVGDLVGGQVQSFAWDKEGKRLAISFKSNPESILLFRTNENPTVEFNQLGVIQSENSSYPLIMEFHDKFKDGSLLTICWSDGNCQHVPLSYGPQEWARAGSARNGGFNSCLDNSFEPPNSPKTIRSLTNFCHVSGNNSISSFPTSLTPINKVQHMTTLYSLNVRPELTQNDTSS